MSRNYSSSERKVASFFRKFPFVKRKIKYIYQRLNYLMNTKEANIISDFDVLKIEYKENMETFFGYYDKSPMNESQTKIIFHASLNSTKRKPNSNNSVFIILKDIETSKILYQDEVETFNWQQGCKLQWIDNDNFIYNSYDNKKCQFISKLTNSKTLQVTVFNYPIYDSTKEYSLSLNFKTLAKLRPDYGYRNEDQRFMDLSYDNDGVFKIDHSLPNSQKLIISISDLISLKPIDTMKGANHKVNHIMISPGGKKFMFLHRWFLNGVKYDRLIVSDFNGQNIQVVLDNEMVSHCYWMNEESIISYANTNDNGDAYYIIDLSNLKITPLEFEGNKTCGDGHPNIFNEEIMLFDTYPDRSRMKNLFKLNMKTKELIKVGAFFESFKFQGESRCDLHPRWSPKGNYIFIDSVHENEMRHLYMIKNK